MDMQTGILGLLAIVAVVLVWLTFEVRKLHDAIAPLATSPLARAVSSIGN